MLRICSLFVAIALVVGLPGARPAEAEELRGVARIVDGDTLELAGARVRLFGIDAPESNQRCRDARGRKWDCGDYATKTLAELAKGHVLCERRDTDRYGRMVAVCRAEGRDVGGAMVELGAAWAYRKYSLDYVRHEARAEAAGRGLWSGEAERAETFRKRESQASAQPVSQSGGCVIKGNISEKGRIYHVPGQKFYAQTRISEAKGERWFCSEDEARAAGWRRAGG